MIFQYPKIKVRTRSKSRGGLKSTHHNWRPRGNGFICSQRIKK